LAPSLGSRWAAQRVGRWARQAGRLRALVQRRARAGLADAECQTQPRHAHLAVAPKPPIPHHHRRRHRHQAAVRSPAGVAAASRPAVQTVACPSAYRMVNTLASVVGSLPHRVGPVEGEGRLREGDPSCPSSGQTQTHRAAYDTVKRHCLPSDAAAVAAAARRREGAMPLCRRHRQPPCSPMLMMRLSAGKLFPALLPLVLPIAHGPPLELPPPPLIAHGSSPSEGGGSCANGARSMRAAPSASCPNCCDRAKPDGPPPPAPPPPPPPPLDTQGPLGSPPEGCDLSAVVLCAAAMRRERRWA
jgi:hypothetical protein